MLLAEEIFNLGPFSSQYTDQYQGLSVPTDDRLPWNPCFSKEFHFQENINNENWQQCNYSCFTNKNNENPENSQLFVEPECFSSAIGSISKMQTEPRELETDQSIILQNTINENRAKHFRKSRLSKDGCPRRKSHSRFIRYRPMRVLKQIDVNITNNFPFESRKQSYQNWSHVPVFEWSQPNLSTIPEVRCFRNITFRSESSNKYNKNLGRSRSSVHNDTARSFLGTTSEETASRAFQNITSRSRSFNERNKNPDPIKRAFRNITSRSRSFNERNKNPDPIKLARSKFTARNLSGTMSELNNYSTRNVGNAASLTSYAKCLSGGNMDGKRKQVNSATANNSKNFKEDDDVMYLFSVDPSSEGKLCVEIDLLSDGENLITNSNSAAEQETKNESDQSIVIIEEPELNKPVSRKRKLSKSNDKTSQKRSHRPSCSACKSSYDDVIAKKQNMFISSSCSHVFCGPCIKKDEKSKVCPTCEMKFIGFRRLYV